jgi:hypothetical protein
LIVLGVLFLAAVGIFGIPWIELRFSTVSTDDAFVNGHVTFVAPRVKGQISRVLVDDNNRVRKGDLLVELDKEPYRIEVAVKRAAVDTANADLRVATAMVGGIEAQARSRRWKLQHAVEDVENQIALLRARVAALAGSKAALALAQVEFDRVKQLLASANASRQELMSPAGFFALLTMPVVGFVLGRGADARWLIAAGLLVMTAGNYWMSQLNLDISSGQVVWPRVALIVGLAVVFAPANVAAYLYTPKELRGAAVGLLSLLRNEGGSVGTSSAQTFHERRDQFHSLRLG